MSAKRSPGLKLSFLLNAQEKATFAIYAHIHQTSTTAAPIASVCTLSSLGSQLHHKEDHGVAANHEDPCDSHVAPTDGGAA